MKIFATQIRFAPLKVILFRRRSRVIHKIGIDSDCSADHLQLRVPTLDNKHTAVRLLWLDSVLCSEVMKDEADMSVVLVKMQKYNHVIVRTIY